MTIILNENDNRLLAFCMDVKRSIGEIAKYLDIAPKNVSTRLDKLEQEKLITIEKLGHGKKTFVRTKKGDKKQKYLIELLNQIKRRGEVTEEEYPNLLPQNPSKFFEADRLSIIFSLPFFHPKLIKRTISLTKEGKEYLKKHSKK